MTFQTPDLSEKNILRTVAGIRPCRHGGLRIETETFPNRGKIVVHHYGHGGCGVTLALGTAPEAADLAEQAARSGPETPADIAVLGAGVVGLATARELLSRGHRVTVYARQHTTETTSNIAGALWLPTGIDFPPPGPDRDRFNRLLRAAGHALTKLPDRKAWGVERLTAYEPHHAPFHPEYFESGVIETPKPVPKGEPLPGSMTSGRAFTTEFIHTPRFLRALASDIRRLGGTICLQEFTSLDAALDLDKPIVVNCLALASREVFGDEAIYPARGVLVHMKPHKLGYIVHDGYRYMFPREDALVLGGSFEPGVEDPTPPPETVRDILEHHRAFFGQ